VAQPTADGAGSVAGVESMIIGLVVAIVVLGIWVIIIPRDATAWVVWFVASIVVSAVAVAVLRRVLR
jgi:fructose-specific phosphotransferase system IIC component